MLKVRNSSGNIVKSEITKESKELRELDEPGKLKGLRRADESIELNRMRKPVNIDNNFSISNIKFEKFSSSSIIKGEIKNNSRNDFQRHHLL